MNETLLRASRRFPAIALFLLFAAAPCASIAQNIVQEFYVPLPEDQIRATFLKLYTGTGPTFDSVISIVVNSAGTKIVYDQWEDGYEIDLNNPTQSTTRIWGDGILTNGVAPGTTNDLLVVGTVVTLRNNVALPRNPASILYDGRDRFGATKAVAVTRAAWALIPGTVLGSAVSVNSVLDYGTDFLSPVGEDISASSMFEVVDLFVESPENGTTVRIDKDANGVFETTNTLNRGESLRINGGILKGARVSSSKPVQCHLMTGDIAANYESRSFNLFPTDQWSSVYYTPVGTAANGDQSYVFLYNPNTNSITVQVDTLVGTTNITVATNGYVQYQVPQNSGAKFAVTNGSKFFAVETVGANPAANNVHDWGFTLVPEGNLTPIGLVGWGPGSSDLSQNGSPVWVTTVKDTTLYVDLNGDGIGPFTNALGDRYDIATNVVALKSLRFYDTSDKDQTGMRVFTADGTLLTAAWGQDPAVAGPASPYLDMGTTILPFPQAVIRKSSTIFTDNPPTGISTNDILEYTITIDNNSLVVLGNVIVLDAPPAPLVYQTNTASRDGNAVADDVVPPAATKFPFDESGYVIPVIPRGSSTSIKYRTRISGSGTIANGATIGGDTAAVTNEVIVPPPAGSTACSLDFTDSGSTSVLSYAAGASIYVTLRDADANQDTNAVETVSVTVQDPNNGDLETITLTELSANTNTFRNAALASSITSGLGQQDGTLHVSPGDTLSVTHTDPIYGDVCSDTATISIPTQIKPLYLRSDGVDNDASGSLNRVDPAAAPVDVTTSDTTGLGLSGGGGSVGVAVVSTNSRGNNGAVLTNSIVIPAGATNRLLLLAFAGWDPAAFTVSTPTNYAPGVTQAMTLIVGSTNAVKQTQIYAFTNAPTGTNVVVIRTGGNVQDLFAGLILFTNVDLAGAYLNSTNKSITNSVVLNPASANDLVFDLIAVTNAISAASGQSTQWNFNMTNMQIGASTQPGAATPVTNLWNVTGIGSHVGVSIKAIAGGGGSGGTNMVTFTQSQTLCENLNLPAGGVISVTNYVNVTNGAMPGTPNITARLRYGTNIFAVSTTATYNASVSNLSWGITVGTATSVPAGQAIALDVETAESGVQFDLLYDSSNKQSKITLPTTNIIHIDSFAIYDAPYSGSNAVSVANNGAVLFVRTTVGDPFGSYDIRDLNLVIDGPGTADDIAITLSNSYLVVSNSCSKTYEYMWQTGMTQSNYALSVTANEGSEGITAVAATAINLSFQDLGTPCASAFTLGSNGPATNQFGTNVTVCVRVTDLDQNTNFLGIDTLPVIVTSSSGDTEPLTMTETSTNSGIFTACLSTTNLPGFTGTNSVLSAPAGSVLTLTYVDPDDSSDICSATAVVPTPGAGISITKTLLTPSDGQAVIGDAIQFRLRVSNIGGTTLTPVQVTDTFPTGNLTFVSSTPANNTLVAGLLTWTNVGPLIVGSSTDLFVNFTALASANPATNRAVATANGGAPAATNTATVIITHPALTVDKVRITPPSGAVNKGSNVSFQITITNIGDTAVATLPLEDTFSGGCFTFVSASPTSDANGYGSLFWSDLTGAGSLAAGAATTVTVTLAASGGCDPADNLAAVSYAVDVNGDSVPPASDTASVTTLAARITGTVYDDRDLTATFTTNDVVLEGVAVSLYTDPNGDGDPADGALVDLTTTLADGSYEFLNLGAGNYVVVETDPASYVSTGDTSSPNDNRIPVVVGALTTYSGNNFFDAQIAGIDVQKTVSSTGAVPGSELATGTNGTVLTYSFVASNLGSLTLTNVIITDSALGLTTNIGSLTVTQSKTATFASVISADLTNTASIVGQYAGTGTVSDTDTALVDLVRPGLRIVKTSDSAADGAVENITNGANVVYTYKVINTGDTYLASIVVTDNVLGAIGSIAGPVPPGSTNTLLATNLNVAADVTNLAVATATPTDSGGTNVPNTTAVRGTDSAVVDVVHPGVLVIKTAGNAADGSPLFVLSGSNVVYTYQVINTGDTFLSSITLTDNVLGAIGSVAGPVAPNTTNTFLATNLNVTAGVTNLAVAVGTPTDAGGTNLNVGTVSGSDNAIVIVSAPAISVVKTAGGAANGGTLYVLNGSNVVYTYKVINSGDVALTNIVVNDNVLGAIGTIAGPMLPNTTNTLLATNLNVAADVTNVGTVTGNPTNGLPAVTNTDSAVVDVVHPGVLVIKTAGNAADGSSLFVLSGSNVIYTYQVINTGDTYLSSITVTDNVLGAIGSIAGPVAPNSTNTLLATNLNVTAGVTNLAVAVGTPTDAGGTNLNVGTVTGSDNAIVLVSAPGVSVVKTAGAAANGGTLYVLNGSNVVYTYKVVNSGDVALTNIVVSDDVLGAIGTIAGPLLPNTTNTLLATNLNVAADVVNVGTVTGNPTNGLPAVTNTDSAVVDVVHPGVLVIKTAGNAADGSPLFVLSGSNVLYTYKVINTGDTYLSSITLTDNVLGAIGSVAGPVAPNTTNAFLATNLNVTAGVTNLAVAVGTPTDAGGTNLNVGTVTGSDNAIVIVSSPAISIVKSAGAAADGSTLYVLSGSNVVYTYQVINSGDVSLTNIVVTDNVLGVVGTIAGPLAPNSTNTLLATNLNVSADVTNVARASGYPTNGLPGVTNTDSAVVDVVHPGVLVIKTAGSAADGSPLYVASGANVVYTYKVINTGDTFLSSITLTDNVLGAIGSVAGPVAPNTTNTFLATNLNVTAGVTNLAVAVGTPTDAGGTNLNVGTVTGSDNAIVIVSSPAISVVKSAGAAADGSTLYVLSGSNVVYTYQVINSGDVSLTNIVVTDNVLGVVGTIAGPLAPNSTNTLLATNLNVSADVTNVARASGYPTNGLPGVTNTDSAVVDVVHPGVLVIKTAGSAADGSPLFVLSGSNVIYTYQVINTGDTYLSSIAVTDNVLGAIGSIAGPVAPNTTNTLLATNLNVTASVTNVAVVSGTPTDAGGTNLNVGAVTDNDDAVVRVSAPGISVVKTAGGAANGGTLNVLSGSNVVYTYKVINSGDVALTNIVVTDNVLGSIGTIAGPLAPNSTNTLLATNLNVSADVTNVATVTAYPTNGLPGVTNTDSAVVDVVHPGIVIVKTAGNAADSNPLFVLSGSNVVYTYKVINTGDTYLSSITVTDDVLGAIGNIAGPVAPNSTNTLLATNLNVTADVVNIAIAVGTPTDAGGTNLNVGTVTDADDAVVDVVHPGIVVVKTAGSAPDGGPLYIASGSNVVYTYIVINTGDTYLSSITVTDNVLGTIGNIAGPMVPHTTNTLLATNLNVTAGVTNIAVASATPTDAGGSNLNVGAVTDSDDAVVLLSNPAIAVVKTAGAAADGKTLYVLGGSNVVYTYRVINAGDVALTNIVVTDNVLGVVGIIAGPLAPNTTNTLLATNLNVSADVTNVARASGYPTNGLPGVTNTDSAVVDVVHPGVVVIKTAGNAADGSPLFVLSGSNVVYTYKVINTGDTYLSSITVTDNVLGSIGSIAGPVAPNTTNTLLATNLNITAGVTNVAVAAGTPTDAGGTNLSVGTVSDNDDAVVLVNAPGITVVKTAGAAADGKTLYVLSGSNVVYTYRVINAGDVALTNIVVTDNVLGVVGTIAGPLAPNSTNTLLATNLNVTADVTNVARASGYPTNGLPAITNADSAVVDVVHPGLVVIKTAGNAADGSTLFVLSGSNVVYAYQIINTGDTYLSSITVTDNVLGPVGSIAGPVAPNSTNTLLVTNAVSVDVTNLGVAVGTPTDAGGTNLNVGTVTDNDDAVVDVVAPGITLSKTLVSPSGRPAVTGEVFVFRIAVTNTGDITLQAVPLVDTFQTNLLSFVSATPPQDGLSSNVLTWNNLGPLLVGQSAVVTAKFTAAVSGNGTNSALSIPTTTNGVPVPPRTSSVPYAAVNPSVLVTKTILSPTNRSAAVGEPVVFKIVVTNTGDVALDSVPLADTFNTNLLSFVFSAPAQSSISSNTLAWTNLGPIGVGSATSVIVQFTAIASGAGTNAASSAPTTTNGVPVPPSTGSVPHAASAPGFTVTKTWTAPTNRAAQMGEGVVFTITVSNTGNVTLLTVPVSDTYETSVLTYTGSAPASVDNVNDGTIDWTNVGPLSAGSSTSLVVNFTAAGSSTSLPRTNSATASPTTPTNEPPVPPLTNSATYATARAGFSVTKTLTTPTNRAAQVGSAVVFQVLVQNTGDVALVTVRVTDAYLTNSLGYVSAVPPESGVATGTITWANVGPLAAGSSTSLVVQFTALTSTAGAQLTNRVAVTPTTATNEPPLTPLTNTAPYAISRSGFSLAKTLLSPTNRPPIIGETVTFQLTVQNTGDVTLLTVPVADAYNTTFLTYTGAVPASDDNVNDGTINWSNIGPVSAGASTSVVASFTAAGSSASAQTNRVTASPTPTTNEPPVPPRTSTVPFTVDAPATSGDFVWDDLNHNGVQDGGEPGVANVTVTLFATNGAAVATNVTSGSGAYAFTNIVPGDYYLQFTLPPGYEFTLRDQGLDTADSDADASGVTIATTFTSGESDTTWDAGMFRRASIGDFVWNDANANGIQNGGEGGMTNVTVSLYTGSTVVATTTTSTNGFYSFTNLLPGSYSVGFTKPFGYLFSPADQGGNDAVDSDPATGTGRTITTTLTSGENDTTWDAGLFVAASLGGTIYNDQNNDGTQQVAEVNFQNVQVQLFSVTGTGNVLIATQSTDANGDYRFNDLTPGTYYADVVNATVPAAYALGVHFTDPGATNVLAQGQNVTDEDFGYRNVSSSANIGDFVWSDGDGDGIQDAGEPGIGGVTVSLIRAGVDGFFGTADDVTNATAVTAASGYYEFTNVVPGTYVVRVKDGTGTPLAGLAPIDGVQSYASVSTPFLASAGEVVLDKDFGYSGRTGSIGNQLFLDANTNGVFDSGETPLGNVTINLLNTNGVVLATITSDSTGQFRFFGLIAGKYVIDVTDIHNVLAGLSLTTGATNIDNNSQSNPFTVTLAAGAIVYADFGYGPPPNSIGSSVFSDLNGNGVYDPGTDVGLPGVTVTLFDSSGTNVVATDVTDANGLYLFTDVLPGTYRVDVNDPTVPAGLAVGPTGTAGIDNNSQAQPYTVTLVSGGSDMTADFGYTLSGPVSIGDTVYFDWNSNGVLNASDTGIGGLVVELYLDANGNGILDGTDVLLGSHTTDTNGNYLFTGLAATDYLVRVQDPLSILAGAVQTQGSTPQAVDVTDGLSDLTVDLGFYPPWPLGILGDNVWLDTNGNGLIDENIAVNGINGVQVNLYRITGGSTNFVATTVTTNGPGGARGYYQFTGLQYGDYHVEIVLATVPPSLIVPTTSLTYNRSIGPAKSRQDADFGFMPVNPKAVQLTYFRGAVVDGVVALRWGTALELNTLGFNILRAATFDGDRVALNDAILPGMGAESGYEYQFNDASAQQGALYYYWLEEVENNYHKTPYGPVVLSVGDLPPGPLASFIAQTAGVYRITYDTLAQSGLPAGQIAPGRIKILVNGQEVALFVSASGAAMKQGDFVLFYAPDGAGDQEITVATGDGALRMDWVYVEPQDGAGDVMQLAAVDGVAPFRTSGAVARYLLTDFDAPPVWVLDVTDAYHPKFLFGEAELPVTHGLGVYLSYFTDLPAACAAYQDEAVHEVTHLTPR